MAQFLASIGVDTPGPTRSWAEGGCSCGGPGGRVRREPRAREGRGRVGPRRAPPGAAPLGTPRYFPAPFKSAISRKSSGEPPYRGKIYETRLIRILCTTCRWRPASKIRPKKVQKTKKEKYLQVAEALESVDEEAREVPLCVVGFTLRSLWCRTLTEMRPTLETKKNCIFCGGVPPKICHFGSSSGGVMYVLCTDYGVSGKGGGGAGGG